MNQVSKYSILLILFLSIVVTLVGQSVRPIIKHQSLGLSWNKLSDYERIMYLDSTMSINVDYQSDVEDIVILSNTYMTTNNEELKDYIECFLSVNQSLGDHYIFLLSGYYDKYKYESFLNQEKSMYCDFLSLAFLHLYRNVLFDDLHRLIESILKLEALSSCTFNLEEFQALSNKSLISEYMLCDDNRLKLFNVIFSDIVSQKIFITKLEQDFEYPDIQKLCNTERANATILMGIVKYLKIRNKKL